MEGLNDGHRVVEVTARSLSLAATVVYRDRIILERRPDDMRIQGVRPNHIHMFPCKLPCSRRLYPISEVTAIERI